MELIIQHNLSLVTGEPSVKTLYLLRHAKSAWDPPHIADHERTLNARGRAACLTLARHMAAAGIAPGLVLVSDARRTRETWERIAEQLDQAFPARELAELYLAAPGTMRKIVRGMDDELASVMLVAHNPGLEELAHALAGVGTTTATRRLAEKFPTGGLATLVFVTERWSQIAQENCRLTDFVTPASLGHE